MKRTLIATLMITVASGGIAMAQTAPAPATTETPAATTAPATEARPSSDMAAGGGMQQSQGGFYTYQEGNQMLGSGLMGADIRGPNNENIGEVNDLLLDSDGQVMAVIVGVGGFLGIGEKDVAIANDQLEFVLAQDAAANNTAATGTTAAPNATTAVPAAGTTPATGTAMAPAAGVTATGATTTPAGGTTAMGTAPAAGTATSSGMATTSANGTADGMMSSGRGWGWSGAGIDHIQVNFTREQLESAPEFETAD